MSVNAKKLGLKLLVLIVLVICFVGYRGKRRLNATPTELKVKVFYSNGRERVMNLIIPKYAKPQIKESKHGYNLVYDKHLILFIYKQETLVNSVIDFEILK